MEELIDGPAPDGNDVAFVDEAMLEMGDFLSQMTDVDGYLVDAEMLTALTVEKVNLSMPIQLDLHVRDDGSVLLGGSPPLYYTETTFSPVFHQLTINIIAKEKENQENEWRP
ncbi:MAG: hypothetical protein ABIR06_11070 [Cyclobacteriaceae bacterium]